ncbi:hypothetical protein JB92DRAFT_3050727 [Gautieria morchelliformis]|nr:hypothetical protein JB92DRAFT_3050727 [Gautieria morchelliformis]
MSRSAFQYLWVLVHLFISPLFLSSGCGNRDCEAFSYRRSYARSLDRLHTFVSHICFMEPTCNIVPSTKGHPVIPFILYLSHRLTVPHPLIHYSPRPVLPPPHFTMPSRLIEICSLLGRLLGGSPHEHTKPLLVAEQPHVRNVLIDIAQSSLVCSLSH